MTAGLFTLALIAAAPPDSPPLRSPASLAGGLQTGDSFTFAGTVAEAIDRPAERFRRYHSLEVRVLVLDREENWADAVVLTRLKRTEDAVSGAVPGVTGNRADKNAPPLVRLDIVRVHADGTVHLLSPAGPPPLRLAADTPATGLPPIPLDGFSPAEFGIFPPRPPRDTTDPWTVASAGGRPAETWQAKGTDPVNAERCRMLVMNQMSEDWAKPVGGQTAWLRADAVWVSTQDGTARKVHRVIKHRDGLSEAPAAWVEVKYELKEQGRLGGRTFERTRRDAEVAYCALADAASLGPAAVRLNPKLFDSRVAKLDSHIADSDAASPYREALLAARRTLDSARRGELAPAQATPAAGIVAPLPAPAPARSAWPEPGDTAPDLAAGAFRLADHRGKPVVVVFLRPGGETTDLALSIANAIEKRYAGKVAVGALVVFGGVAEATKERDRLKFTLPLFDGSKSVAAYGVETVPRFALIDAAGKVRWTFTGVGAETGFLLKEEADRLVSPASPAGAGGKSDSAGTRMPPIAPRP